MDMLDEAEMDRHETCLEMSDAKKDDTPNERETASLHPDDSAVKGLLYNVNEIPPVGIVLSIAMQVELSYIHSEMLILKSCETFLTFQSLLSVFCLLNRVEKDHAYIILSCNASQR